MLNVNENKVESDGYPQQSNPRWVLGGGEAVLLFGSESIRAPIRLWMLWVRWWAWTTFYNNITNVICVLVLKKKKIDRDDIGRLTAWACSGMWWCWRGLRPPELDSARRTQATYVHPKTPLNYYWSIEWMISEAERTYGVDMLSGILSQHVDVIQSQIRPNSGHQQHFHHRNWRRQKQLHNLHSSFSNQLQLFPFPIYL